MLRTWVIMLFSLIWISSLIITVGFNNSITCTSDLHFFLIFLADLLHGTRCSALSSIQWMFLDMRQPKLYFSMGHDDDCGHR